MRWIGSLFTFALIPVALLACSYCDPAFRKRNTLGEETASAKLVVVGTLENAKNDGITGSTDFIIRDVIRAIPPVRVGETIPIPRYLPQDPTKPVQHLMFGERRGAAWELTRGMPLQGNAIPNYLRGLALIPSDAVDRRIRYAFEHLDHADGEVSADAFLTCAKAADADLARVAKAFGAVKFRALLTNPHTPADRLGVVAYLLGVSGEASDVLLFREQLAKKDERTSSAFSGLFAGYIELAPQEGWANLLALLRDEQRPYADKLAAVGTVRFQAQQNRKEFVPAIRACYRTVLEQGDLADLAIEDLRRSRDWSLTDVICRIAVKPTHQAPLMRRAILRYMVTCPELAARTHVERERLRDAEAVRDAIESLERERQ